MKMKTGPLRHSLLLGLGLLAIAQTAAGADPLAVGPKWAYFHGLYEHDDQGSVWEPDRLPGNCIADLDGDLVCEADGDLPNPAGPGSPSRVNWIAPGCTDDQGRQLQGLCALYSTGLGEQSQPGDHGYLIWEWQNAGTARTFGIPGMSGVAAPGLLTPTKQHNATIFDLQLRPQLGPVASIEYVHPLADFGIHDAVWGLGYEIPDLVPGPNQAFAWFGRWQDKNGNGVLDEFGGEDGTVGRDNEFVWVGNACGGIVAANGGCERLAGARIEVRVWPDGASQPANPTFLLSDQVGNPSISNRLWSATSILSPVPGKGTWVRADVIDGYGAIRFTDMDLYSSAHPAH